MLGNFGPMQLYCKVRPIHGRELAIVKCGLLPEIAAICARDSTIRSVAYCAKRLSLSKQRSRENNSKVNPVVQVTMSSEGTERDDSSVLARGVTRET